MLVQPEPRLMFYVFFIPSSFLYQSLLHYLLPLVRLLWRNCGNLWKLQCGALTIEGVTAEIFRWCGCRDGKGSRTIAEVDDGFWVNSAKRCRRCIDDGWFLVWGCLLLLSSSSYWFSFPVWGFPFYWVSVNYSLLELKTRWVVKIWIFCEFLWICEFGLKTQILCVENTFCRLELKIRWALWSCLSLSAENQLKITLIVSWNTNPFVCSLLIVLWMITWFTSSFLICSCWYR